MEMRKNIDKRERKAKNLAKKQKFERGGDPTDPPLLPLIPKSLF